MGLRQCDQAGYRQPKAVFRRSSARRIHLFKDAIGKAWQAIQDAAKAPIRFVVETVINDGIIGNFNKVAEFFGTKKIPEIKLPKGFAGGG